ncbi:unnamed protein product [Vitrella brassicaformis CCMP3155]|uniref:Exostosin GT47 domain-containing protein n=1 Tax=Vitrella brassicaformis (strain CCMP3155) TaxID=1169540 RepID=A0A0G4EKS1_VITBC|nr:unnamed protein product [Vitrella brassicaformis CCMP3155]|eukprot:CEL97127.1 unnamed protein product [Vitrella brassicaformis CCMP3155]
MARKLRKKFVNEPSRFWFILSSGQIKLYVNKAFMHLTPRVSKFAVEGTNKDIRFSRSNAIIIPGYVQLAERQRIIGMTDHTPLNDSNNASSVRRPLLFVYCGHFRRNEERRYLKKLIELKQIRQDGQKVYVGHCKIKDFVTRLVSSKYCGTPRGNTPWTSRFYKSLVALCVPVLFSRSFLLPFRHLSESTDKGIKGTWFLCPFCV